MQAISILYNYVVLQWAFYNGDVDEWIDRRRVLHQNIDASIICVIPTVVQPSHTRMKQEQNYDVATTRQGDQMKPDMFYVTLLSTTYGY